MPNSHLDPSRMPSPNLGRSTKIVKFYAEYDHNTQPRRTVSYLVQGTLEWGNMPSEAMCHAIHICNNRAINLGRWSLYNKKRKFIINHKEVVLMYQVDFKD